MKVALRYQLEARDAQGRVLNRRTAKSRSYVRAFLDTLYVNFGNVNLTLVPDTGGVNRTLTAMGGFSGAGQNDNSIFGPVVGTGTNAVAIDDNKLQTQILHGLTAGKLDHEVTTVLNLQTVGSTRSFQLRRVFINSSGGVITINECGIYCYFTTIAPFCFVRDLVAGGLAVPNGGSATLVYTIGVTA